MFNKTSRSQVKRAPKRGYYDRKTLYEILDAGFLCHISFCVDDQPFNIPTLYGRMEDRIVFHGATASRMIRQLAGGLPCCICITHVDGLVLARSAFHHSMNYRSAVLFGTATEIADDKKEEALRCISEQILAGRWEETRQPNQKELRATSVLEMEIESASSKIRTGPPLDDEEDYQLPIWAGEIPLVTKWGDAIPDPRLRHDIRVPESVNIAKGGQA